MKYPMYTILYNTISTGSNWVGIGYEFFDNKDVALKRYTELSNIHVGREYSGPICPTLRSFHHNDITHLGAIHNVNKQQE